MKQKKTAVIFDLDGTLCDHEHRRHYICTEGKKDWDSFYGEAYKDKPIKSTVKNLMEIVKKRSHHQVIFLTGRPEKCREETVKWFDDNIEKDFIKNNNIQLFMRSNKDRRPNEDMKKDVYEKQIEPKYKVLLAFDDNEKVIKMWHKLRIITFFVKNSGENNA